MIHTTYNRGYIRGRKQNTYNRGENTAVAGYKTLTTKGRIQQSPPLRIQQRQDTNH